MGQGHRRAMFVMVIAAATAACETGAPSPTWPSVVQRARPVARFPAARLVRWSASAEPVARRVACGIVTL